MKLIGRARRLAGRVRKRVEDDLEMVRLKAHPKRARLIAEARRVHVGCGPKNHYEGWVNVDVRPFPGVDLVLDVTRGWPFTSLEHVYSEHFLEHLDLQDAVQFLERAGKSLVPGGKIRLSTPNLAWVWATHFTLGETPQKTRIAQTMTANRAFHGWGHQFLWSREIAEWMMLELGYSGVTFHSYGESEDPVLRGLERHGGFEVAHGEPSVIIFEATRGSGPIQLRRELLAELERDYLRYVRSGH